MVTEVLVAVHVDTSVADSAEALRERVTALEAAGAHLLTFAPGADGDGLSAVEAASFAAAWTDRVGLVPVVDPVHAEPFHVSNQLSSLDRLSRGRAGWWVQVVDDVAHARVHGTVPVGDQGPAALAHEVSDVVAAVRLLWDSWEDGALVADRETGRFLDTDRVHHVDFVGQRFSVKGPALLPRPPQGQVPVVADATWLDASARDVTVLPAAADPAATRTIDPGAGSTATNGTGTRTEPTAAGPTLVGPSLVDVVVAGRATDDATETVARAVEQVVQQVAARAAAPDRQAPGASVVVRLVPAGAGDVVGQVLAALRAAGLVAPPPGRGQTLRDLLGLPRPAGRLVAERRTDEIGARR